MTFKVRSVINGGTDGPINGSSFQLESPPPPLPPFPVLRARFGVCASMSALGPAFQNPGQPLLVV